MTDVGALAEALLRAGDSASLLPLPSDGHPGFDLAQAFEVADRALRRSGG